LTARWLRWGLAIAVVVGLLSGGAPATPSGWPGAASASGAGTHPGVGASPFVPGGVGSARAGAARASPTSCAAELKAYTAYFGAALPADVARGIQTPCQIGHDEPALSFVSNGSYSGSRLRFAIDLPSGGAGAGAALSAMWAGLWLAGVPCSYGGMSYLEVELLPPYSALTGAASANWSVTAPVWDLVPAGSCDPQCQNDTAFLTIGGLRYCEDDAAIDGVGASVPAGWTGFAPGDRLTVSIVGRTGGPTGTSVFVNDSTDPGASVGWTYGGTGTVTGAPLTPFFNASTLASTGWRAGGDAAIGWLDCPAPAAAEYASACNSYNGPAVAATGLPRLVSAAYWNASTLSYSTPFAWTATTSTSDACSGSAAPCADFDSYGGTGAYPFWSLHAFNGSAWWLLGGSSASEVTRWGGPSGQFAPGEAPVPLDPTTVFTVSNTTVGNSVSVSASVADPNGVAAVAVSAYFCFGSSTPSTTTAAATLTISPWDTVEDGNWTTTIATGSYTGTLYYAVRAESSSGVWAAPVAGSAAITGVTACTFSAPPAPGFAAANATPIAGGYSLTWNASGPGVVGYAVDLNASGSPTVVSLPVGNVTHLVTPLDLAAVPYDISVTAVAADGETATSAVVAAPAPLAPLGATVSAPTAGPLWAGAANLTVVVNATGGAAPFTYAVEFGDGTTATRTTSASSVPFLHGFAASVGAAWVRATVTDADGVAARSAPVAVPVWATPLGVPQAIASGEASVRVSWGVPASPAGPVEYYTVFYTTNPDRASTLTAAWPSNDTGLGLHLWNTTADSLGFSEPDGTPFYAQVVAWDAYGAGQLPAGSPILEATPAPLLLGPIVPSASGPAPARVNVSAFVENGTNDPLLQSIYTADNGTVPAAVHPVPGGAWVNATLSFVSPGPHLIVLHVTDSFYDIAIQLATVYVAPGVGPSVLLTPPTTAGWFGWQGSSVAFAAEATGTGGPYAYTWQFGDGGSGVGANVTHIYSAGGSYSVVVTVQDEVTGGMSTVTHALVVYALPSIAISALPGPDGGLSLRFGAITAGGSGSPKVTWSFGDGGTSTGVNVAHDYAAPGTYVVNATSTDPSGRTASTQVAVVLQSSPAGPPGGGTFLGVGAMTVGVLLVGVAVLAVIFLAGMAYFWSRARRRTVGMAPEPAERPDEPAP
jgi:PKD domain